MLDSVFFFFFQGQRRNRQEKHGTWRREESFLKYIWEFWKGSACFDAVGPCRGGRRWQQTAATGQILASETREDGKNGRGVTLLHGVKAPRYLKWRFQKQNYSKVGNIGLKAHLILTEWLYFSINIKRSEKKKTMCKSGTTTGTGKTWDQLEHQENRIKSLCPLMILVYWQRGWSVTCV